MIIGIDASRNRSGGAISHLVGIIEEGVDPSEYGIDEIHLWSYDTLLDKISDRDWLIKHSPKELNSNIFKQIIWQRFQLPSIAKSIGVDVMLYTDASALIGFQPCVVMSRDMLSFEPGQMGKFGFGKLFIRLLIIKCLQIRSLNKANGAIFLTKYAYSCITKSAKKISNYRIIPHGVGNVFSINRKVKKKSHNENFNLIYVSNASFYKNQWILVEAISDLRKKGFKLNLQLVGARRGVAIDRLNKAILKHDPHNDFVEITDFLDHNEIIERTLISDLYVFASSCENMPNTLIEGMSMGIPIICSNRGPMMEVLKDGGEFFDPECVISTRNAILFAIQNYDKMIKKSKIASDYARHYSWHRCCGETFEYLTNFAKRNNLSKK